MKTLLFVASLLFVIEGALSQTYVNFNNQSREGLGTLDSYINNSSGVEGTPYLFDSWMNSAKIYLDNGKTVNVKNINFNAETSQFVSQLSRDSIFTYYKIYKVEVNHKNFERIGNKFYEVLFKTNNLLSLLKYHTVEIEPERHKITNVIIGPGSYINTADYYINDSNSGVKKITLKKKEILKILASKKAPITKFAKDNRLSYAKEKDVIKIFQYYNSINN